MRLSADKTDKAYSPHAHGFEVFLDGVRLEQCITADEELGIALCIDDAVPIRGDCFSTIERRGKVEIRPMADRGRQ